MPDLIIWGQNELVRLRQEVDRLFDDLCCDLDLPTMRTRAAGDLSFQETDSAIICRIRLPEEMDTEDIKLVVNETSIIVTGHGESQNAFMNEQRLFRKEVRLPCPIQTDHVSAAHDNGYLEVTLPRCRRPLCYYMKEIGK